MLTFARANILLMIPAFSSWTKRAIASRITKTTRYSDPKSQIAFLLALHIPAWLWRRCRCCSCCRGCCRTGTGIEWLDEKIAKSAEPTSAVGITVAAANSSAENAIAFSLTIGIVAVWRRCCCRRCSCGGCRCCYENRGGGGGGGGWIKLVAERCCKRFLSRLIKISDKRT